MVGRGSRQVRELGAGRRGRGGRGRGSRPAPMPSRPSPRTPPTRDEDVVVRVHQRGQHLGQVGQRLGEHAALVARVQVACRPPHLQRQADHAAHAVGDAGQPLAHPQRVGDYHQARALKPPQVLSHGVVEAGGALVAWGCAVGAGGGSTGERSAGALPARHTAPRRCRRRSCPDRRRPLTFSSSPSIKKTTLVGQAGAAALAVLQQLLDRVHKGKHGACTAGEEG